MAGEEGAVLWELRVAPLGQPAARPVELETIENLTVIVFDAPRSGLEPRIEQSDNDVDLIVRNDSDETIVVQLLHATKLPAGSPRIGRDLVLQSGMSVKWRHPARRARRGVRAKYLMPMRVFDDPVY